jgi:hypothetical protein
MCKNLAIFFKFISNFVDKKLQIFWNIVKFCTQKKAGPERYCNLRKVIGLIREEGISLNQIFIIYFIWLCNLPR